MIFALRPICEKDEFCGGCRFQGRPYEEQLDIKAGEIRGYLKKGGLTRIPFSGIKAAPSLYEYRNKMEYSFGDECIGGPLCLGMHKAEHYMSIITTDCCQLVHPDFNRILRATLDYAVEKGYSYYHKKRKEGLLRNLILRRGVRTGEIMVNLVVTGQGSFDWDGYREALSGLSLEHRIAGLLETRCDSIADAIICEDLRIIRGRDYYEEEIMGLKFNVSAFSFFQTNVPAAERLYREALELIPDLEGKTVFDLYCGTGTISQAMALKAREVVGVEIVEEAVEAAKAAAKRNGLSNCRFVAGDVLTVLDELPEKPDVIVVDPPRSGIHPKALQKILNYGVKEILYISCNPKTQVQNLSVALEWGYEVCAMQAYDNFPFTKHTECVALLRKMKAEE